MSALLIAEITSSLEFPNEIKTLIIEYSDVALIKDLAHVLKLYFSEVFRGPPSKFMDFEGITLDSMDTIDRVGIALRSDPIIKSYFRDGKTGEASGDAATKGLFGVGLAPAKPSVSVANAGNAVNIIKWCIKSFNDYDQFNNKMIQRINSTLHTFGNIKTFGSLFNDIRCIFDNIVMGSLIRAGEEFYFRLALVCYIFDSSNSVTYYFNKIQDIKISY